MRPEEHYTRQFYAWERRGRGSDEWPEPVRLEPPFRPFLGYLPAVPTTGQDDGRRPGLFQRFAFLLADSGSQKPTLPEPAEPEPEPFDSDDELVELTLALPEGARVEHDAAEHFLLSLAGTTSPVAFELVATAEKIAVQWTARESDAPHVAEELRTFFPQATVRTSGAALAETWSNLPGRLFLAELGLAREFMLPLRTFLKTDPDPLLGLFGALAGAGAGEMVIVQVLFEPARNEWAESVFSAVTDGAGGPFFLDAPDLTSLALEKVSHPLFAAVFRIAVSAPERDRCEYLIRQILGTFGHFGRPDGNEFTVLRSDLGAPVLERDIMLRQSHRTGMLLSVGELVALVHPPSASVAVPKLVRRLQKTKAAPAAATSHALILGVNEHAGETRTVSLTTEQRMRHVHVVGASGTGKSTFLLDLILQTIALGEGVGVLDPHGDLVDEVLSRIPDERAHDVVILDAADADYPVGFNILAGHTELERTLLASDLVGIFRRLATTWGDQMQTVLANAIQAFLSSSRGGSVADLRRFLVESDYRREFLDTVEDEEIVYYWTKEFPLLVGKPAAPILTRLDGFLRPKPLRAMLAQRESKFDFREIMDKQRIFLVKLAQGAIGEENAALLGSLVVAKLHQAALSRQDTAREARKEFTLVIDEFQDLVTPSVAGILAGTRKYRLGLVAAHQSMRPVIEADPVAASALLANAATRIVFRVGDDDAKKLADGFASFDAQALTSLGVGEAIARIERADHDFNLRTRVPETVEADVAVARRARLIAMSRGKYASPVTKRQTDASSGPRSKEPATTAAPEARTKPKPDLQRPSPKSVGDLLKGIADDEGAK
jgi:hypothetical protein